MHRFLRLSGDVAWFTNLLKLDNLEMFTLLNNLTQGPCEYAHDNIFLALFLFKAQSAAKGHNVRPPALKYNAIT